MTETKETPKAEPEITADTGPYYPAEHGITGSDGFRGPSISWFVGRNKLGEARQIAQIANIAFAEGAKAERAMISEREKTITSLTKKLTDLYELAFRPDDQEFNAKMQEILNREK